MMRHVAATTFLLLVPAAAAAPLPRHAVPAARSAPPSSSASPAFCAFAGHHVRGGGFGLRPTAGRRPRARPSDAFSHVRLSSSSSSGAAEETAPSCADASDLISGGGGGGHGGIYRAFAEYAWSKLEESGLFRRRSATGRGGVPDDLASNVAPARGMPDGTTVGIEVRSMAGAGVGETKGDGDGGGGGASSTGWGAARLARYALLETLSPPRSSDGGNGNNGNESGRPAVPDAIHVLNLVVFPNPNLAFDGGGAALPVLGLDLVTLPGGKHLVAMDFQPVLSPPPSHDDNREGQQQEEERTSTASSLLLPGMYSDFETRLTELHRRHCIESDKLPWGGDIPDVAKRYFSPFAVWTRQVGDDALSVVRNEVWDAFRDYVDLYVELLLQVQRDAELGSVAMTSEQWEGGSATGSNSSSSSSGGGGKHSSGSTRGGVNEAIEGQRDYLRYRRENDPARPMLKSLYGEEWAEKLIGDVLFRMI